ncbi:MAG: hypothetical protein ACRC6T_08695 [Sarcina sp.]
MDKGYESILKVLGENEKIIFTTDRNFKFGEKNTLIIGEKFFCISNLGIIYIADKNKRLKAIKVNKYDSSEKNIKFKVLNKDNIVAINSREFTENRSESFIINMKMDDFVNVCKKVNNNPFIIEWSKYTVKVDEGIYESALVSLKNNIISVNSLSYKVDLKCADIIDFKVKGDFIHIISNNKEAYNILVYGFNKDVTLIANEIENYKRNKKNIELNYFSDTNIEKSQNINEISAMGDISENTATRVLEKPNVDATIIDIDGSFRAELDKTISNYYRNEFTEKEEEKEIISDTKVNLETKPEVKDTTILNEKKILENLTLSKNEKSSNSSYGKLYGHLNSINYKGRKAAVSIEDELKIIDKEIDKELVSIAFEEFEYTKNDTVIILKKDENMILVNLEEQDLELDMVMKNHIINNQYIGYTSDFQPFDIKFDVTKMILRQGTSAILREINANEIADINILDGNLNFESIAITLTTSEIYKIFIMRANVKNFIKELYKLKTKKTYQGIDQNELADVFNKTIVDELKVFYFGDLVKLKVTIDDFYKSDDKNRKHLIENIYNTISKVKKSYKLIRMYYFEKFEVDFTILNLDKIEILSKIENDIFTSLNAMENKVTTLECFRKDKQITKFPTILNSDMNYVFEKLGLNMGNCIYDEVTINTQIADYKFDEVIKELIIELNYIINLKFSYYYKLINLVVSQSGVSANIEKQQMIETITGFFVEMQMKSKIDNKTRLKDILFSVNKFDILSKKTHLKINTLDLVKF